jgi:peptidoglycan hydrolase CwlO-like protein
MSLSTAFERELDDVKTQVKTLHRSYQSVDGKIDNLTTEVVQLRSDLAAFAKATATGIQDIKTEVQDIKNVVDSAMAQLLEKIDDGKCRCK